VNRQHHSFTDWKDVARVSAASGDTMNVRWIKLSVSFLDDEKIRFIRQLPTGDTVVVIFIGLLCLCAKKNADGQVYLTEQICYSESALADLFGVKLSVFSFALKTLEKLGMIRELDSGRLQICNWEKWQTLGDVEKIREQTARRVRKFRQKKEKGDRRQLDLPPSNLGNSDCDKVTPGNVKGDVIVTLPVALRNAIEKEKEYKRTPLPSPLRGQPADDSLFVTDAEEAKKLICEKILGGKDPARPWSYDAMKALSEQLPIPRLEIERIAWRHSLPDDGSPELVGRSTSLSETGLMAYWGDEVSRAQQLWKKWHGWEEAAVK
jgi:predicted phage replisome organizer